ncbi:DUF4956 domain-containing protein [Rhodospirillales bacterium]|jgi:uncharacterized membrane protein YhiD involved in acid resistance|nr:DUF4956 domain-containing protein [Rhodospirillales bacterium]
MEQQIQDVMQASGIVGVYQAHDILINMGLAVILGMLISFVYKITHKGLSYSQSFMLTIVFITIIVSMVMMVIGNNVARAFALVGALSIIRFRTVVKDTKDTAFIFLALSAGMAAGTSSYFLATIGTTIVLVVAAILDTTNYGSLYKSEFILKMRVTNSSGEPVYSSVINEFTKTANILHVEGAGDGNSTLLTFDVIMKNELEPKDLVQSIQNIDGVSEVMLVASINDVDY